MRVYVIFNNTTFTPPKWEVPRARVPEHGISTQSEGHPWAFNLFEFVPDAYAPVKKFRELSHSPLTDVDSLPGSRPAQRIFSPANVFPAALAYRHAPQRP